MLKKRILASTMASVMALSSVSVVAFADDKTETPKTEAVSKKQLEAYIESLDKFVDDELDNYGDAQTEKLENAIAYAENVVADRFAATEEYTAAYQMVKSIKEGLKTYTGEQLQDLLDDYKSDLDSENKLNKNDDLIWTNDSFRDFEDAYGDAEDYVDSKDLADTTNAYIELEDAHKALEDMDIIKKSDFRKALKEYEAILKKKNEYQSWRRGKCTVGIDKDYRDIKNADGDKVDVKDATYVTYGELYNIIEDEADEKLHKKAGAVLGASGNNWFPVGTTVKALINDAYTKFDNIESANETSDESIIQGYEVCLAAIDVYNGWEVDDAKRGSKTSIESLLDDYRADLVKGVDGTAANSFLKTYITDLTTNAKCKVKGADAGILKYDNGIVRVLTDSELDTAQATAAEKAALKVKIGDDGLLLVDTSDGTYKSALDAGKGKDLDVKPGQDLTDLIPVTSKGMVVNVGSTEQKAAATNLQKALAVYEIYAAVPKNASEDDWETAFGTVTAGQVGFDATNVNELDDNDSISEPDGGSPEYRLIWRNIKYAIDDLYPAASATYKKRDVEKIVDDAYELAELTGDAETFASLHQALVDVRQDAVEWLAAADVDGYKDSKTYKPSNAGNRWTSAGADATTVKKAVQEKYDDLEDKLKEYPMSYGEIAELIATVAEGLDDKAYGTKADDVKAKLQTVAIGLSTLETKNETDVAFDDDREFLGHNRLNIKGNDGEKQLYKDIQALQDAIEKATDAATAGDVDGNGTVDLDDAKMVLDAYVGAVTLTDDQAKAADMDGDGDEDMDDAQAIVNAYVGL